MNEQTVAPESEISARIVTTLADLIANHFREVDEFRGLKPGVRVHHVGERFERAEMEGTATILHVLRKGTDERPDSWERYWGRPNVEVIVRTDLPRFSDMPVTVWADYHCVINEEVR